MKEEYRISRNVRLAWFLSKLNQVIQPSPKAELVSKATLITHLASLPSLGTLSVCSFPLSHFFYFQEKSENELDILSILPKGWQPEFSPSTLPYQLVPATRVNFLARRYRFIIELDLSPSTGIVVRVLVSCYDMRLRLLRLFLC